MFQAHVGRRDGGDYPQVVASMHEGNRQQRGCVCVRMQAKEEGGCSECRDLTSHFSAHVTT